MYVTGRVSANDTATDVWKAPCLVHPPMSCASQAAQCWLMINHALAAFTDPQRGGRKIHLSSTATCSMLQRRLAPPAPLSHRFFISARQRVLGVGCVLFFQQQLRLHAGFATFTTGAAAHLWFSTLVSIKAHYTSSPTDLVLNLPPSPISAFMLHDPMSALKQTGFTFSFSSTSFFGGVNSSGLGNQILSRRNFSGKKRFRCINRCWSNNYTHIPLIKSSFRMCWQANSAFWSISSVSWESNCPKQLLALLHHPSSYHPALQGESTADVSFKSVIGR